jgi:hypothetical protein
VVLSWLLDEMRWPHFAELENCADLELWWRLHLERRLKIGAWKIACTVEEPECIRMEGIAAGGCIVLEDPEYTHMEGVSAGGLYSRFGDET